LSPNDRKVAIMGRVSLLPARRLCCHVERTSICDPVIVVSSCVSICSSNYDASNPIQIPYCITLYGSLHAFWAGEAVPHGGLDSDCLETIFAHIAQINFGDEKCQQHPLAIGNTLESNCHLTSQFAVLRTNLISLEYACLLLWSFLVRHLWL